MTGVQTCALPILWRRYNKCWFRTALNTNWNNAAIGAQNPATNTGGMAIGALSAVPVFAIVTSSGGSAAGTDSYTANFGATTFVLTPPAGFGNL